MRMLLLIGFFWLSSCAFHPPQIKYIIVVWPDSEIIMKDYRSNECFRVMDFQGYCQFGADSYFVPTDLYYKYYKR